MTPDPADDDGVLTPDDLQLDDENVEQLGENRYLIRSDESSDASVAAATESPAGDVPAPRDAPASTALGASDPTDALANAAEPYGVDITLKTDAGIERQVVTSRDVRDVFVTMLRWYASQLDPETPPDEALRIMLAASDIDL